MAKTSRCTSCEMDLPVDQFKARHDSTTGALRSWCKRCDNLRRRYRISGADWDRLYDEQGGSCAVCREEHAHMEVDHDHESGKVRALLCRHCNLILGHCGDDPAPLRRAIAYLEKHGG